MKKVLLLVLILLCVVIACAENIPVPDDLTGQDAEVYKRGYADGYYAAQHGTIDERHPENSVEHYVVNTSSGRFHYPSCNGVQSMNQSNRMDFYGTREEAIAAGYTPCGSCDP